MHCSVQFLLTDIFRKTFQAFLRRAQKIKKTCFTHIESDGNVVAGFFSIEIPCFGIRWKHFQFTSSLIFQNFIKVFLRFPEKLLISPKYELIAYLDSHCAKNLLWSSTSPVHSNSSANIDWNNIITKVRICSRRNILKEIGSW